MNVIDDKVRSLFGVMHYPYAFDGLGALLESLVHPPSRGALQLGQLCLSDDLLPPVHRPFQVSVPQRAPAQERQGDIPGEECLAYAGGQVLERVPHASHDDVLKNRGALNKRWTVGRGCPVPIPNEAIRQLDN